jgi:redox-sensitive bicupin YhaK (pirin superfamily)
MNQMQSENGISVVRASTGGRRRHIVLRSSGHHQGPVTRLVCPSEVGEIVKPFISLDRFDFDPRELTPFPLLPYSGSATLTILLSGDLGYEDTADTLGHLEGGGVAWMRAGNGVWHGATPASDRRLLGYRLWIALPPELEHAAPTSL